MCHSAYDANASWHTWQAKASPSGRWRFVPPKGLSIERILQRLGIEKKENEIYVKTNLENLAMAKDNLMQAINALNEF